MDKVTLSFTMEQMRVIDMALSELPFKVSAPLIQDINAQLQEFYAQQVPQAPEGE